MAKLPVTYKHKPVKIRTTDDIWKIVDEICKPNDKYSVGQILYYTIPFFANCNHLFESWQFDMINEYNYIKRFNISLGKLDDVSAYRLDCFTVIENELNACSQEKAKKENG